MTKKEIEDKIISYIEEDKEESIGQLQEFLRRGGLMNEEESAQKYYAGLLEALNLDIDMWYPKAEDMDICPYFLAIRNDYSKSPDLVGRLKGNGGRSMMLNGHVDVVPVGINDWEESPWSGTRKNGGIYGRGACDMKGGLMANYMAVKAIVRSGIRLGGDVFVASVIGEETGGAGTISLLARGYRADGAIIPEPSDLVVCPVSLGVIWYRIRVRGRAAHAANAYLGVNAISKAAKIVEALDACNENQRQHVEHPLYPKDPNPNPFNINIGTIQGGNIATSVADETIIEGRIAFSPDEDVDMAKKVIEDAVAKAAEADPWMKENPPAVEWHSFCLNSGKVDQDHPLTTIIKESFLEATGEDPAVSGTPWGTDAGAMIRLGGIPTIVFGPGPNQKAHQANEYVDEEMLIKTAKTIALAILKWCGTEE